MADPIVVIAHFAKRKDAFQQDKIDGETRLIVEVPGCFRDEMKKLDEAYEGETNFYLVFLPYNDPKAPSEG